MKIRHACVCMYFILYRLLFCIVFVYCTVTNLAAWLQETNKVYWFTYLPRTFLSAAPLKTSRCHNKSWSTRPTAKHMCPFSDFLKCLQCVAELSMGWVESGWIEIFQFSVGWVGSTIAKVLKFWKDCVNAFKALLDKIWLHQAVKFVSCIGLGWVSQLMGWVGSGRTKWTHGQLCCVPKRHSLSTL